MSAWHQGDSGVIRPTPRNAPLSSQRRQLLQGSSSSLSMECRRCFLRSRLALFNSYRLPRTKSPHSLIQSVSAYFCNPTCRFSLSLYSVCLLLRFSVQQFPVPHFSLLHFQRLERSFPPCIQLESLFIFPVTILKSLHTVLNRCCEIRIG